MKDLSRVLDNKVAEIEAQKMAHSNEEKRKQEARDSRINRSFDSVIIPFLKEHFTENAPKELLDFLDNFGSKIQKKLHVYFSNKLLFWAEGLEYRTIDITDPKIDLHDKAAWVDVIDNRGGIEKIDLRFVFIKRSGNINFGFRGSNGIIEWFISDRESGVFSEKEADVKKMVDAFADVLTSENPSELLCNRPEPSGSSWGTTGGIN